MDQLIEQLNFVISDVYNKLDYALQLDNKGITVTPKYGGLGEDVSAFDGLVRLVNGDATDISVGTGLQITPGGALAVTSGVGTSLRGTESVPAVGLAVVYATAFASAPFLKILPIGDTVVAVNITAQNAAGFTVYLVNVSGMNVAGTINWESTL